MTEMVDIYEKMSSEESNNDGIKSPVQGRNSSPDLDFNYDDEHEDSNARMTNSIPKIENTTDATNNSSQNIDKKLGLETPVTRSTIFFCLCAALNSCNLGYDIGVSTVVTPLLQNSDLALTDVGVEIFVGSLNLFAMIGAFFASQVSDRFGRRKSFIAAAIGFIIGVLTMACAQNYTALMVGRAFVGVGVGLGLAIDPMYISEISPEAHRGRLVTWSELAINVGIVLGFSMGLVHKDVDADVAWRTMLALGAVPPTILILLVLTVMPESPRWLISKGYVSEGREVLRKVYPPTYNVDSIVKEIQATIRQEAEMHQKESWSAIVFPTPAVRRMLLVGLGAAIAQQLSGIDSIQYFMLFVIDEAGINDQTTQYIILLFLGVLKMICIIIAGRLFDTYGRIPLMKYPLVVMITALLSIAFCFYLNIPGLGIVGLALFLVGFSFSLGPGCWLIPSEVFALSIRAKGMSIATFLNRTTATIMTSTFLSLAKTIGYGSYFLLNSFICALILVFFNVYLPETKGKSLEEMSLYFAEITGDEEFFKADRRIQEESMNRENIREESGGGIIT